MGYGTKELKKSPISLQQENTGLSLTDLTPLSKGVLSKRVFQPGFFFSPLSK